MAWAWPQPLWNPTIINNNKVLTFIETVLCLPHAKGLLTLTTEAQPSSLQEEEQVWIPNGIDLNEQVKEVQEKNPLMDQLDVSFYTSLLQCCINNKSLTEGKLIHTHIIQTGFDHEDLFLDNTLITMYAKCGSLADGQRILNQMPVRNAVSWTVMIAAYTRQGYGGEALALFYQMQRAKIQPNKYTFASVLPAFANLGSLKEGRETHEGIIKRGFQNNVFVGSALIDMYVKCGSLEDARKVFDKMPERDVVLWNAMIAGYAGNGRVEEALELFDKMPERNVVSWNAMIAGFVQSGRFDEAHKSFHEMPVRDEVSMTTMIVGYAHCGHVDEALRLFLKMPNRNVVSWNAMIAGFAHNGRFKETLELFQKMKQIGVKPDFDTFSCVLQACANLAALESGKEVHEDIKKSGFQSDVYVGTALVDMYAKCGSITDARNVFDIMSKRDVVSWNAMISGYAMNGCGKEAIEIFEQMKNSLSKPNKSTFIGVLSACCHAGLVDEGWKYFDSMSKLYNITPVSEHYCCMVDLLGRAGYLDEAHDFINRMSVKPDATIWMSLLAACRIHSDAELGEQVAECLFELDPTNDATYVLLSNIYAAAGRWDDFKRIRALMKERKVEKKPGSSWIEVNNTVYAFLVGDKSHPQLQEIYMKLDALSGEMKEAGYVSDTRFVLQDVEEEQKEQIIGYHSEKLAIAFGLMNTCPGTTIRVVKNLRVCGDCHCAIKFISRIAAREIVVRDANRFHRFQNGQCSCGDYW